jgi:hypothetical protein
LAFIVTVIPSEADAKTNKFSEVFGDGDEAEACDLLLPDFGVV